MTKFKDVIESREQLREIMGEPIDVVVGKTLKELDKHCNAFISRSPFMLVSSADANGNLDVSPKGDPIGFVKVIDPHTLVIPDRPGNRRADTIENILQNPNVGLIFLIPGKTETLRVSGTAQIVRDEELRASMAIRGRSPEFAIAVHVKEAFFHCSKCMIRSKLWKSDSWPSLEGLPRLADTMVDALKLDMSADVVHELVLDDEKERLY